MTGADSPWTIRDERSEERAGVARVNRAAFGGEVEARLVERLHADDEVIVSLVAVVGDHVVGHVLFSALAVETATGIIPASALAPLAVLPDWQRRGIGSALVNEGMRRCRAAGRAAVFVLGEPAYYGRFGCSVELVRLFHSPYDGDFLMATELIPGALAGRRGVVRYPAAFTMEA